MTAVLLAASLALLPAPPARLSLHTWRAPPPLLVAEWDELPWADEGETGATAPDAGVLLHVEEEAEALQPDLGPLVELDCTALLDSAQLPDAQLSLTLCDDDAIASLNAEWRGKERPTDVLSFPMGDELMLGDIVISVETAARQAAARGHGVRDEVRVLLVHGLLHLLGHDHELGEDDHAEMAESEQELMRKLGWTGDGLVAAAS